jgi:hypothetical protein
VNVTLEVPGKMSVEASRVIGGRTLVYADADDTPRAITLWLTPEVAAQWIEALTPLSEGTT